MCKDKQLEWAINLFLSRSVRSVIITDANLMDFSWIKKLHLPISSEIPFRTMHQFDVNPDSKVHGANMGPTWVLSAPDGPHEPCYQGKFCAELVDKS